MSRKLASIQRVYQIDPIEGADRIELAHVLGWQCVVNKGQFQPMDLGIYFEIDSFLPIRPEFEFMRASSYKKTDIMGEGFKLRTQKFRGQISQGLLLPVTQFPEIPADAEVGIPSTVESWQKRFVKLILGHPKVYCFESMFFEFIGNFTESMFCAAVILLEECADETEYRRLMAVLANKKLRYGVFMF